MVMARLYWRSGALVNVPTGGPHGPGGTHPEAGGQRGARHVGTLQLSLQRGAEALGADRRLLPRRVREGGRRVEDRAHRLHLRLPRGVEPGGHAEPPAGRAVSYGAVPKYASSTRMYGTQWRRCFTSSRAASSERPSRTWRYAIATVGARFKPALQCT